MRFSEQWLRTWINPQLSLEALMEAYTMAGLEVDAVEPAAPLFKGVVVAEIKNTEPHPTHTELKICQITLGHESKQVVCGAKNAAAGMKVAYAAIGADLPDLKNIQPRQFGDISSEGMLLAWSELGIDQTGEGILSLPQDAPLGESVWDYLALDDNCIEIDLTPNRGDCLSIQGLARELNALTEAPLTLPKMDTLSPTATSRTFPIQIDAAKACPHYVGRIIEGINASAATPVWMQERLRRSGIRSISIVVDILNYVMLELGQPMHAFDFDKLDTQITVRMAAEGESLVLLDSQQATLTPDTLVIADQAGPIAIAGVMGGLDSGVTLSTQSVFLESALFSQACLAGRARAYGLVTDASSRFERGVDPALQIIAIERATAFILEYCGGQAGPVLDHQTTDSSTLEITLRQGQVQRILGLTFTDKEIENFLERLQAKYTRNEAGWVVIPPTYRYDLRQEIDLIEECGRLFGYNNIPVAKPVGTLMSQSGQETQVPAARMKRLLIDNGYHEVITYSFVNPKMQSLLNLHGEGLALKNPISQDLSVMRTSLWPGLLTALLHNLQRQQTRLKLFETGLVFRKEADELAQIPVVGGVAIGGAYPEAWAWPNREFDFYDMKGEIEQLWRLTGNPDLVFKPCEIEALHPGQSADIYFADKKIGYAGALHPALATALDIEASTYLFEIELSPLTQAVLPQYQKISKYPQIRRDLALLVDEAVAADALLDVMRNKAGELLKEIKLFDVYQGKGIPSGKKSLAIALILQANSRTLVDSEVEQLLKDIMQTLQDCFAAELRD